MRKKFRRPKIFLKPVLDSIGLKYHQVYLHSDGPSLFRNFCLGRGVSGDNNKDESVLKQPKKNE